MFVCYESFISGESLWYEFQYDEDVFIVFINSQRGRIFLQILYSKIHLESFSHLSVKENINVKQMCEKKVYGLRSQNFVKMGSLLGGS
jgi:hypothetical protein